MSKYTSDTLVRVCPFARREEGETVTIGDLGRQVFLTVPAEALLILDCLAAGQTVGEARDCYHARYGEVPDIEDFLEALEPAGFVATRADECQEVQPLEPVGTGSQLGWLSQSRARRLCQPAIVAGCALAVAVATILIARDPATVPGPTVLVFKQHLAAFSVAMFAFAMAGVAVHEFAHLVAARAAGVQCRIGVSHRLWIVVAETDMTGIWMAPKRARYRAFLAGPLVDAASAAFLVGVLWSRRHGWIGLSPLQAQVVGACLMLYMLRLLWQCFFFVRTDFYFVLATAFDCKNLLVDTQNLLHNRVAKILRGRRTDERSTIDQSSIPAAEMRVVRWYSLIWLAGRAAALFTLFFVTLPVLWRYGAAIVPLLIGGRSRYSVVDAIVFGVVTISLEGAGLIMWIRSLFLRVIERRRSHAMATAP